MDAGHSPVHDSVVRPVVAPKLPAEQGAGALLPATQKEPTGQGESHAVPRALSGEYVPATQSEHTAAPVGEYLPGGHTLTVGVVDPAGQEYPGLQGPVQVGEDSPGMAP